MSKPKLTDNRLYMVRVFSEIGRKWVKHIDTLRGVRKHEAQKLIDSFKEAKGEIVPYVPEKANELVTWLVIPAV